MTLGAPTSPHKLIWSDAERSGYLVNIEEANISFAAFNTSNITTVKSAGKG
jgi:hypothetical protein